MTLIQLRVAMAANKACQSLCIAMLLVLSARALAAEEVDFNRDVRPILSDKCFSCHGPDVQQRKAELRLGTPEGAYGKTASGAVAVKPSDSQQSAVWARINTTDTDEMMPPPESHKPLPPEQRKALRRWIAAGARYEQHWAFVPPRKPELPVVRKTEWPRNPADHFILARLENDGLAPSPEAQRTTLIHRVTLDLTGLPPTIAEVNAFLGDNAPDAYERVVNRLMATRDYAEWRAQDWLDLARYADAHGFADDQRRTIWPFREWVIAAIQRNQPFDQFTIEQLAGDMLPNATTDRQITSVIAFAGSPTTKNAFDFSRTLTKNPIALQTTTQRRGQASP